MRITIRVGFYPEAAGRATSGFHRMQRCRRGSRTTPTWVTALSLTQRIPCCRKPPGGCGRVLSKDDERVRDSCSHHSIVEGPLVVIESDVGGPSSRSGIPRDTPMRTAPEQKLSLSLPLALKRIELHLAAARSPPILFRGKANESERISRKRLPCQLRPNFTWRFRKHKKRICAGNLIMSSFFGENG